MTRLKIAFIGIFVFLSAMWLLSLSAEAVAGFWPTRNTLVYYTGVLAIGFMSVAVILAARPVQIEGALGGLDKFYRLHKWLGIAATLLGVVHWLLELIPRWMVRQGWLERPPRGGGGGSQGAMGFDLFRNLRGIAADLGEWSSSPALGPGDAGFMEAVPIQVLFQNAPADGGRLSGIGFSRGHPDRPVVLGRTNWSGGSLAAGRWISGGGDRAVPAHRSVAARRRQRRDLENIR